MCTDARRERGDLAQFADSALAGGVDIIQLRDKGSAGEQQFGPLEARDELAACEILADAARRHGALFAVNDRADIARVAGADVLHLGQGDLPVDVARDIAGPDTLIGLSTHDAQQLAGAASGAPDYFCVGPCWPTPTKPGRAAPGLELVRAAAALGASAIPWRMLLSVADSWEKPKFSLSGRDVIQAGVPEGPRVGKILSAVEDWWIEGDFTADENAVMEKLKAILATQ